jgi:pimeloyl-ACP methyl ester carboxylesterase
MPARVSLPTADVVGVLDALGITGFDLVGHSLGAHLTAQLAGRHPDRVRPLKPGTSAFLALLSLFRRGFDRDAVTPVLTQLRAATCPRNVWRTWPRRSRTPS